MKKLIRILLFMFLTLPVFGHAAYGQQIIILRPAPTLEDYEKELIRFNKVNKKTFDLEMWEDAIIINKITKKEKNFTDLSTVEQKVFILDFAQKQSEILKNMSKNWESELKKFDNPEYKPLPRISTENAKQMPALKNDVIDYQKKLLDLRKTYAKQYEGFAEQFVKDNEKEFSKTERNYIIDEIRKFHNVNKLIERK